MADDERHSELFPEHLVAENVSEAVWLRLRRLTSSTLCERIIQARAPALSSETANQKGQELASSVRSALGYWQSQASSLNAKVLTRYYALLQVSVGEQVADPVSTADLREVQSHTEKGHGLWTISAPQGEFPANYMIACVRRGHFYEYCRFKGIDLTSFVSKARPDIWADLPVEGRHSLIPLSDLFKRIPELRFLIEETFGTAPLSFRIGHSFRNRESPIQRADPVTDASAGSMTFTYVDVYPDGQKLTAEHLNSVGLPIKNFVSASDELLSRHYFTGELRHPAGKYWHQCLEAYKSGYCGTSVIAPFWGDITDPFVIHLVTLYALSIVVRYLPLLWHEIEDGKLNHIRALIEQYLSVVDNVVPRLAVERLTGRRLIVAQPGSLYGPK